MAHHPPHITNTPQPTLHSTQFGADPTQYTEHCTLQIAQYMMYTHIIRTLHCTLHSVAQFAHGTSPPAQDTLHITQCKLHSAQCTVHTAQHSIAQDAHGTSPPHIEHTIVQIAHSIVHIAHIIAQLAHGTSPPAQDTLSHQTQHRHLVNHNHTRTYPRMWLFVYLPRFLVHTSNDFTNRKTKHLISEKLEQRLIVI